MNALLDYVLHLLYPPRCMFCSKLLQDEDAQYCNACIGSLPEHEGADPSVPGIEQTVATFVYEDDLREAVLRYKFRGMKSYGPLFAKWMAVTVRDKVKAPCDLVSWVPCSKLRKWNRGYDQAEILAKTLADELGLEVHRVLVKKKHNTAQSRIKKDAARRRANVSGVYAPYEPQHWAGKRVLLVDDVLTTGATVSECAKTLRLAGAENIVCAVIADAGRDKEKNK